MARLKTGLYRELKQQGEWTFYNFPYPDHDQNQASDQFLVTASGALNPFAITGPCTAPNCRSSRVPTFARTVGVWADRVFVPDAFSMELRDPGRLRAAWVERFCGYIRVLRELEPLVRRGIIDFCNPSFAYCDDCQTRVPLEVATQLVKEFEGQFTFELNREWLLVESPLVLEGELAEFRIPLDELPTALALVEKQRSKRLPATARQLKHAVIGQLLGDHVAEVFLDLLAAQNLHSVVLSGSRTDLLCLKAIERQAPDLAQIEAWEDRREVKVPYLSELTSSEVVTLRDEAASALPRFRERFARVIATGKQESIDKSLADLRSEAAEVGAELAALAPKVRRRDRTGIALVATGVALYGVAALGVPAASGAAQLLTTLGLIHGLSRADRTEEAKLKSRPGYVLLKARELLAHRRENHRAG